ncbi:major facilitator superfamily transporter [Fusarium beomiforme]|uniref:Major facilitator superfamily transporter n=1 Tax=Fusarium beomiforme TaxID=44412 RepID=A0A9P5DR86_9HYPO|nr:major facilitator superfamily transporter [Fusarium beomiforme]
MRELKPAAAASEEIEFTANTAQHQVQAFDEMDDGSPISYKLSTRTYIVLIVMGLTWGTCTMANIGPSTTSAGAASTLGGDAISSWIPNASLFPIIGLQPVWGSLADRFGKKWFIAAGGIAGVVGNIVAGTAKSTEIIIAGQTIAGLGSSLFLVVIPASMEIVPAAHRSFAQGLLGSINGCAAIMALLVAGAFAKSSTYGWRWVYYLNAIFFGTCALCITASYNPPPTRLQRETSAKDSLKSVDLIGIALLLSGIIPIVVSLTWGEKYCLKEGLLDHRFFQGRNYAVILAVAFIDGMLLYGVNAFLPQEIGGLFEDDAVMIAVYLLPLNICVIIGIMSSTYILGAFRHYRILLISSMALISLFCGLLSLINSQRLPMLLAFTGLIGFGVGVTTSIPTVILTYSVPSHLIGTAGTLLAAFRALGGTIGITIFATIYGNYMTNHLVPDLSKAVLSAGLPASSVGDFVSGLIAGNSSIGNITGATPDTIEVATRTHESITAEAFKFVWVANAAIGVIATFCE